MIGVYATDPDKEPGLEALARFPALVIALAWCVALATAVVTLPSQPALGAIAGALAVPCLALAVVVRPACVAC